MQINNRGKTIREPTLSCLSINAAVFTFPHTMHNYILAGLPPGRFDLCHNQTVAVATVSRDKKACQLIINEYIKWQCGLELKSIHSDYLQAIVVAEINYMNYRFKKVTFTCFVNDLHIGI